MSDVRAADLPDGSVVATTKEAMIKWGNLWRDTFGNSYLNKEVDRELAAGAQVLRVGTGEGQ